MDLRFIVVSHGKCHHNHGSSGIQPFRIQISLPVNNSFRFKLPVPDTQQLQLDADGMLNDYDYTLEVEEQRFKDRFCVCDR